MKTLLIILIPIISNYLTISFIIAEYNPNLWTEGQRALLVLISMFTIVMTYTFPNFRNNENRN